ncbi:MAG: ribonuclease HII [Candidatus Lokiarchaeota archaeon]|nr:ribonuclease HII [Candidatus Lokiarchaeota archaeon]
MPKGPVIGPLVLCGVCFKESRLSYLTEIGVKDSKKLTAKRRRILAKLIKESCSSFKIIIVPPNEIDQREEKRITLNRLEELKMAEIVRELKPDSIYIDAVDVNETRFTQSILNLLNYHPKEIISKHKADDLFPIVSAASIIAKDKRDTLIEELKEKYGDLGSGYPSDLKTINFLRNWIKEKQNIPPFARKTWETIRKIVDEELGNRKITDFF